ncbi:MAG: PIN domain-containing protein [Microvirga sp.]
MQRFRNAYTIQPTTPATLDAALDLAVDHRLSIWDAVIFNAAAEAGCRLLLSEDLGEGFTWRGLTVVNPFAASPHPLLARLL